MSCGNIHRYYYYIRDMGPLVVEVINSITHLNSLFRARLAMAGEHMTQLIYKAMDQLTDGTNNQILSPPPLEAP